VVNAKIRDEDGDGDMMMGGGGGGRRKGTGRGGAGSKVQGMLPSEGQVHARVLSLTTRSTLLRLGGNDSVAYTHSIPPLLLSHPHQIRSRRGLASGARPSSFSACPGLTSTTTTPLHH